MSWEGGVILRTIVRGAPTAVLALALASVAHGARAEPAHPSERSTSYPVARSSVVSPEYPVSDPVLADAPGNQVEPAAAFDGTNYLVVWDDERATTDGTKDIYGARVTPAGTVLDRVGFAISTAADDQFAPAVAFDGTNYFVVWGDQRGATTDVYGARVTPEGTVLDPNAIPIAVAIRAQLWPSLAFDGVNYLVAWADSRSQITFDILGARVSPSGAVLDPAGIPISTAARDQLRPSVAFDGANYFVAWDDERPDSTWDIYGARVTTGGDVLDPPGIAVSTAAADQRSPALVFGGANYFVAWEDGRDGSHGVFGTRVTPAGSVLDTAGIAIASASEQQHAPALAFDGTNYFAVWARLGQGQGISGARVAQTGVVLDPGGIRISATGHVGAAEAAVAFDGSSYLVGWSHDRVARDVAGARVSQNGTVLDPAGVDISAAANAQQCPAVAFDGTNYLVAWRDLRSSTPSIYAARVTPDGTRLDGTGIPIAIETGAGSAPAIAFDGANFLVVWEDRRFDSSGDVYGARVTPAGTVLDPGGFRISPAGLAQEEPAVAFDGTNYLVTWQEFAAQRGDYDVHAARVSRAGVVLDPIGIGIGVGGENQKAPAVAFDGTNYLVAWEDDRADDGDVYGARVNRAGEVLDENALPVSTAGGAQVAPALSFGGASYLVAWQDERSGSADLYGARVTPAGAVLDPVGIAVSTAPDEQGAPAVAFDGATHVVVWQDRRSGTGWDLYGARVRPSGGVFGGEAVSSAAGNETNARAVPGRPGWSGVAYQRHAGEAAYGGVDRIFLRLVRRPVATSAEARLTGRSPASAAPKP